MARLHEAMLGGGVRPRIASTPLPIITSAIVRIHRTRGFWAHGSGVYFAGNFSRTAEGTSLSGRFDWDNGIRVQMIKGLLAFVFFALCFALLVIFNPENSFWSSLQGGSILFGMGGLALAGVKWSALLGFKQDEKWISNAIQKALADVADPS